MTEWILIAGLYVVALSAFRTLGGFRAAAGAFQSWGRSSTAVGSGRL